MNTQGLPLSVKTFRPSRGNSILVCLVLMFIIMSVSASTLTVLLAWQAAVKKVVESDQAYQIAEAGIDVSYFELNAALDTGTDGIGPASGSVGRGSYVVTIDPAFAGPAEYTLRSTAIVHGLRRTLQVVVDRQLTNLGMIGKNSVGMSGGIVDTYDSSLGTYASQVGGGGYAGDDAKLRCNGDINLSGSASIYGDATPGPAGSVTGDTSGVTGSTAPAAQLVTFDPYVYSPSIASAGDFSGTNTFTSGVYRYTKFTVGGGNVATFDGNVELYVDEKFTISGSGMGVLNPGATLVIHHGSDDFTISGGGIINQNQSPADLGLFSASIKKITVSGSAAYFGTMYAPDADFVASGGAGVYGAVQALTMTLSGGMSLHYDKALGSVGSAGFVVRTMHPSTP